MISCATLFLFVFIPLIHVYFNPPMAIVVLALLCTIITIMFYRFTHNYSDILFLHRKLETQREALHLTKKEMYLLFHESRKLQRSDNDRTIELFLDIVSNISPAAYEEIADIRGRFRAAADQIKNDKHHHSHEHDAAEDNNDNDDHHQQQKLQQQQKNQNQHCRLFEFDDDDENGVHDDYNNNNN